MENKNPKEESVLTKIWLFLLDIGQTFLITGVVFFVITYFFFRPFQVSGNSMYSNFKDREYIITNLITLRFNEPKRGDVIVFKSPTDSHKDFIKRVIAIPNDIIYIENGFVYLNNEKITESYLDPDVKTYGGAFLQEGQIKKVPEGQFFVLGDNRNDSSDSRTWGFIKKNSIKGISFFVYWPLNEVHIIKNPHDN